MLRWGWRHFRMAVYPPSFLVAEAPALNNPRELKRTFLESCVPQVNTLAIRMNLASMQDLPNILQDADSKHFLRIVKHPTLSTLHGDMWNEVLHNPTPSWVNACTCQRWPSESWSEVELLLFCLWDGEDRPHLSARCRGFSTLFFKSTERYGQNGMCLIVLHLSMFVRPA